MGAECEGGASAAAGADLAADSKNNAQEDQLKSSIDQKKDPVSGKNAPFWTWLQFAGFLCALGVAVALFSSFSEDDHLSGPFAMPGLVREHFASGRYIKVELGGEDHPITRSVRVFVRIQGPEQGETLVLLHGMGSSSFLYRKMIPLLADSGLRVIAMDLPGSGLSDKFTLEEWKREVSGFEWIAAKFRQVVEEIMEKGPFWRMEQLFETGALPETAVPVHKVETVEWPVGADSEELAQSLEQVLDSISANQVHLVLHDTGSETGRIWCLRHPSRVRSVTIIDSTPEKPILPVMLLGTPGMGTLFMRSSWIFSRLLSSSCCLSSIPPEVAEAHAFLLRSTSGRAALLEMARMVNSSASLGLWSSISQDFPLQILWASGCSKDWEAQGRNISALIPRAAFYSHRGSKWPQEDSSEEIADKIIKLVALLPPKQRAETIEQGKDHHNPPLQHHQHSSGDHHQHFSVEHDEHDHLLYSNYAFGAAV